MKLKFLAAAIVWLAIFQETEAQDLRSSFLGLDELMGENSFFDNHLTGFMLYDLDSQVVRYEKNSHIYFIPASTTKLFTFFGALMVLTDSSTFCGLSLKGIRQRFGAPEIPLGNTRPSQFLQLKIF